MTRESIDEGVIKFHCDWEKTSLPDCLNLHDQKALQDLLDCRNRMYELGLIGHDQIHDVGYGNISVRCSQGIYVSGTQTGGIAHLTPKQISFVAFNHYDFARNYIACQGPAKASSETMTHLSIYEQDPTCRGVIHVHNKKLWQSLIHKVPTTANHIPYGTVHMAEEIKRLFEDLHLHERKILAMAGHEDGVISFGQNLGEAAKVLLSYFYVSS